MVKLWEKGSTAKQDIYGFQQNSAMFGLPNYSLCTNRLRKLGEFRTRICCEHEDWNFREGLSDFLGSTKAI